MVHHYLIQDILLNQQYDKNQINSTNYDNISCIHTQNNVTKPIYTPSNFYTIEKAKSELTLVILKQETIKVSKSLKSLWLILKLTPN